MLYKNIDIIKKYNATINSLAKSNIKIMSQFQEKGLINNFLFSDKLLNIHYANNKMLERLTRDYQKPNWGIEKVSNKHVKYESITNLPFCDLTKISISKRSNTKKPILLVSPMSGHYATLLRETVKELLCEHDVYVTEWKSASEVPCEDGTFGISEFIDYIINFSQSLPSEYTIMAVCQPTVAVSVAIAHMSKDKKYRLPKSLILMGGPMVLEGSENDVSELGVKKNHKWFKDNLIYEVPYGYPGRGRSVYPGYLQLSAFVSMNLDKHVMKHIEIYKNMTSGVDTSKPEEFYDEYLAVMDLDARFYLETIDMVFRRRLLEKGKFPYKGIEYSLEDLASSIKVLSIEGEQDDIASVGQTSNALRLMPQIKNKKSCIFEGVGHYGIFSGSKWKDEIRPTISSFI